jgi:hypothetical protein
MLTNSIRMVALSVPLLSLAFTGVAHADEFVFSRPQSGLVQDVFKGRAALVTLGLTDANGKDIVRIFPTWPREQLAGTDFDVIVSFDVPTGFEDIVQDENGLFKIVRTDVVDVRQTVEVLRDSGEVSDLMIESILSSPAAGQYALANIFGTLFERVGLQPISIPDVYADTNRDGVIGEGDILYSLVDLNVYLNAVPSFTLGESFAIVNGVSDRLPGMRFSTTPFVFDPLHGFQDPPFTGTGVTNSFHNVAATPEPSTFTICGTGVLLMLGRKWRGRKGSSMRMKASRMDCDADAQRSVSD